MRSLLLILLSFSLTVSAFAQDKPTADKPVLRVSMAALAISPFDYLKAGKPLDFYGTVDAIEQVSPAVRTLTYRSSANGGYQRMVLEIPEQHFKAVQKTQKVFIQLISVEGSTISAKVLGNKVDYQGMSKVPQFSWTD